MKTETTKKKRIVTISMILGIAVIILSFFSKTIAGMTLPKVTVAKGNTTYLEKEGKYEGEAVFKKTYKLFAPMQSNVKEVCVQIGDKVKKGQLLCLLDGGDKQVEIDKKKLEIEKNQLSIASCGTQISEIDEKLVKAQEKLDELSQKAQQGKAERENEIAADEEDENALNLKQAEETLKVDEALFKEGGISKFELDTARDAVKKLKLKIETDKKAEAKENEALETAESTAVENQEEVITNLKDDKQKLAESIAASKIELQGLELDLKQLEKDGGMSGQVTAEKDGVILDISIDEGQQVVEKQEMMQIGCLAEGEKVSFNMEKDMTDVSIGDEIDLAITSIDQADIKGEITSVKKDKDGLKAEAKFQCEDVKGGENVEVHIKKKAEEKSLLIPYKALNKDKKSYFVYIAEPDNDGMGAGYRIKRANVTIGGHSLEWVEIKEGISKESCVVVGSEKEVQPGMKVKVENEEVFYDEEDQ